MTPADAFFRDVSGYLKPEDVSQLQSAYDFSATAHAGQYRMTGEPYVSHPVAVAQILTEWHLDSQALSAALLHDVMEDTNVTKAELAEKFGKMVAELVDGVSKLDRIEFQSHEQAQAENFRKMVLAMTRDVRVILIKLADRLHNMRTLDAMNPKKRVRIARETLDIYAPIANRLGLNRLFQELQELSFKHLYPNRYRVLHKALFAARGNRREVVDKILEAIRGKLSGATHRGHGHRPREEPLQHLPQDAGQAPDLLAGVRHLRLSHHRARRARRATSRWARCTACTSRSRASSRTTSRSRRRTATSRCTPRCSARSARRSKCRSAPSRCTRSRRPAWPRTGSTSRATPS